MDRQQFFDLIGPLGEFHCVKDLRRFNNQKRRNPKYSLAAYLGHFGHCRNGEYHHCEFHVHRDRQIQVVGYQKHVMRDSGEVRVKSNIFNYWGRGRRYTTPTKK